MAHAIASAVASVDVQKVNLRARRSRPDMSYE